MTTSTTHLLAARGVEACLDLETGQLAEFTGEGLLCLSRKLRAQPSATPLKGHPAMGHSILRYPATGTMDALPCADGTAVDLQRYPFASRHDDPVVLVEDPANDGFPL
jgi:hypothetical protein